MGQNLTYEIPERRALFMSIGTRGDMEPFLTAALLLRDRGWDVVCQFPEQFRSMVEETGIPFYGFDRRFLELVEGKAGKAVMGREGGWLNRARSVMKLFKESKRLQKTLHEEQANLIASYKPDRIIHHPKCLYPYLYAVHHPEICLQLIPLPGILHPIAGRSSIVFRGGANCGSFINRLSYTFVNGMRARFVYQMTKDLQQDLGLKDFTPKRLNQQMLENETAVYPISPTLFAQPQWPAHVYIAGYHERPKMGSWQPSKQLVAFLERYDKVIMVTFGSMSNSKPRQKTKIITDALSALKIPAIINTSWGGLEEIEDVPEHIHFVSGIPYDWIFPKMHAVVHHGGSGTTHTACKFGCPSLIIPHIVDQFFWNRTIARLGLGPLGPAIDKIRLNNFLPLVKALFEDETYKLEAMATARKMANEDLERTYIQCLEGEI